MADQRSVELDALDVSLIEALVDHPRAGVLELSRQLSVARATVQARLQRLEDAGVITGYAARLSGSAARFAGSRSGMRYPCSWQREPGASSVRASQ